MPNNLQHLRKDQKLTRSFSLEKLQLNIGYKQREKFYTEKCEGGNYQEWL